MNVHNYKIAQTPPEPLSFGSRMRRMSRHPLLVAMGVILAGTGVALVVSYIQSKPVTLKIAVGPRQSEDHLLVQSLAQFLARERAPIRLNVIRQDGPQHSAEALDFGAVDLAVVRRDVAMPKSGPVLAVHRRNVVVLIVPAAEATPDVAAAETTSKTAVNPATGAATNKSAARKTGAARNLRAASNGRAVADKPKPIEKIEDLYGKTVAVVGRSPANIALLNTILGQYGVPGGQDYHAAIRHRGSHRAIESGEVRRAADGRSGRQQGHRGSGHRTGSRQAIAGVS